MKRWLGGLVASALAIGACACAIHHIAHIFIRAESYNISFDTLLSATAQQTMRSFIADRFSSMTRIELVQKFQEAFPCTSVIHAHQKRPHVMQFSVHTSAPWLCMSNNTVMTTEGKLIEHNVYHTSRLAALPIIHVPNTFGTEHVEVEDFFDTFKKIEPSIFKQFSISWQNSHHITFTDKVDQWFSIICAHSSLPSSQQLAQCATIKQRLKEQDTQAQADIRFAQQIIVSTSPPVKHPIVALNNTGDEKEKNTVPLVPVESSTKGELYV